MDNLHQELEEAKKSRFWNFFIEKRSVSWVLIIAAIFFGLTSVLGLPREVQPEIKIQMAAVSTALPGANPSDVESLITKPLEEEIANINDIKTLSSSSGFGSSSIVIEFETNVDLDQAVNDVKDAVDLAKNDLPEDATDPIVVKAEANTFAAVSFGITSAVRDLHEITEIAEDVQDELKNISGVSRVELMGGQQKIIEVNIDPKKIEHYGLSIQVVSTILDLENNNLPVGIIGSGDINYSIRFDNRYQSIDDIRNTPLFTLSDENNSTILLGDIAEVRETFPAQSVISKISIDNTPSTQTVFLQVFKKDDADMIKVSDTAKLRVEELSQTTLPKDIKVAVSSDIAQYIREDLGLLTSNGIQTMFLIVVIMFLGLGLRQGIIAGLSVPLIFLITFTVMEIYGLTINSLSIFSLVIALGLMVDTTIVIMEGIHDYISQGLSPKEAATLSIHTFKWPLIAGTLTTVFAFFPMLLVSGILGEFLKTLPITISATLFASLFVSLTLAPAVSTKFLKPLNGKKNTGLLEPILHKVGHRFHNIVQKIIGSGSIRNLILLTTFLLFALSMSLPVTGLLRVEMFPQTDQNSFLINIETPKGTVLEETRKVAVEIESYLYNTPEIDNFVTNIGTDQNALGFSTDGSFFVGGGSSTSNLANISINLIEKDLRERKSYEVAAEIRDRLAGFTRAKVEVEEFEEGPPSDTAITVRLSGDELPVLKDLSEKIQSIIEKTPQTLNTKTTYQTGLHEFKFTLDRDKLAFHGLSSLEVSGLIRNIIQGIDSTTITLNGDDIEVVVLYDLPQKDRRLNLSLDELENFAIQSPKGYQITLGELGAYEFGESLSGISREDQKRIIKITSEIEKDANAVEITAQISAEINKLDLPSGYSVGFGGDLEEINESFRDLFRSMIVGIILIAFSLILMFNSFKQSLIILMTLPMAMIGVFPGLMLIGLNLSFPAFLGIVALAGVVVNNAIILIDRINNSLRNGMNFTEAIAESTESRLQPIFMTTITTIVGILPLALANEFWAGLGFSLVFGLAFSTILTLIVVPVLYFKFEHKKAIRGNYF